MTAYAVGVAMNNFLPANIGTFVTLLMFVAIIPSCTFAGAIAAYLVQKIFFTIAGTFVYLYLFLSVPGSFDESLGQRLRPPALTSIAIVVGGAFLLVVLGRIFWRQVKKLWVQAKKGGAILTQPRRYFTRVFLPALALVALQAGRDRDLPGRLRDPRDVRVDHVGHGLRLACEHGLGDAGRGRHHPGDERARARQVLRCRRRARPSTTRRRSS